MIDEEEEGIRGGWNSVFYAVGVCWIIKMRFKEGWCYWTGIAPYYVTMLIEDEGEWFAIN